MPTGIITLDTTDSLATLGEAYTKLLGWFGDFAEEMLATPLFLIPVGIFCIGACIGLVKRLI